MAFCPLDFEWRTGTFKFEISGRQFRDWRIWRDPRATEAARRYRIATPMLSHHPPHATPPILKGWHHAATDRGSHVAGWGRERRARAEGGESDGVAAMPLVVQLRVCDANLKADTAVRNAACFQQRRIPRSLYYRISMERGGERGGQSERWRSGNVVGALHRGWVKPQVPVMCR